MPLPNPVARQREVVCLPAVGHHVVLGTAGSGKTTMAILRAAFLADQEMPQSGPTLLLTFNKALAAYIQSISGDVICNVKVENYHKFARGYLNFRKKMGYNAIISGWARASAVESAVEQTKGRYKPHSFFQRPLAFFDTEISWLAKHGIQSSDDYKSRDRVGRAEARLERKLRDAMWDVYQTYIRIRAEAGYTYDFDDLATAVADELEVDPTPRRYRHIVVDEGQDLSPEMLRSLSVAAPNDGSLTFFGDVAQQIYGHRMSWRSAGLRPREVWEFRENYRNTREISALGLAIAKMPYYEGIVDMVEPMAPEAAGPKPTLVHFASAPDEVPFVLDQAKRTARTRSVAVLARTVRQVETLRCAAPLTAINLRDNSASWRPGPNLFIGTYHSAKGLEFDAVILPFLSAETLPDPASVADLGQDEAKAGDGRMLYVGVTRARRALILTYSGEISELLPTESLLYTKVDR
ncbi:UvrD-helicase domain-containing protein [Aurantimonas sp. VKM B-3413]|uniref:UvrD-helicase domain-containing protein n=1 Tax=Aurantimonas sp. VKM B-3413 TaxID=2779401 RepID=UPI0021033DEC|nr:UvrD-helicase domain-containing protein [Aurantimonas sp. VKM B-3413]MCB8836912.1 AAA family ATPase [Aurantimonas sp. VKM B-3413]